MYFTFSRTGGFKLFVALLLACIFFPSSMSLGGNSCDIFRSAFRPSSVAGCSLANTFITPVKLGTLKEIPLPRIDLVLGALCIGALIALRPTVSRKTSTYRRTSWRLLATCFSKSRFFISSTYGMMGLMAISETFSILSQGLAPATIVWMTISILLNSLFQFFETKHFFNSSSTCESGFVDSSLNLFLRAFSTRSKKIYVLLLAGSSFLSCVIFQSEQVTNFAESIISVKWLAVFGPIFVFFAIFGFYKAKFSNLSNISSKFLFFPFLILISFSIFELGMNISATLGAFNLIFSDFFNLHSAFIGLAAGAVVNLSRSLYKNIGSQNEDNLALYHDKSHGNSAYISLIEALFMSGLTLISGLVFIVFKSSLMMVAPVVPLFCLAFLGFFVISIECAYFFEIIKQILPESFKNLLFLSLVAVGLILGAFHKLSILSEYIDFLSIFFLVLNIAAFTILGLSKFLKARIRKIDDGFT